MKMHSQYYYIDRVTVVAACLILGLTGCSVFNNSPRPAVPVPDRNQTLSFNTKSGSDVVEISFEDPSIFQTPIYGLALKECTKKKIKSVLSKARQLFVTLDNLSIIERRSLTSEPAVVGLQATATVENIPVALVAYSWTQNDCLHDFLVWSKDVSLVTPDLKDENLALAILDRYVISTAHPYAF